MLLDDYALFASVKQRLEVLLAAQVEETAGVTFHPKGLASEAELGDKGANFTTLKRSMRDIGTPWIDTLKVLPLVACRARDGRLPLPPLTLFN